MTLRDPVDRSKEPAKLCFGGSFNPIHIGHLLVARAVAEEKNFSTVVLIPTGSPPHKQATADLAAGDRRLVMCQLVEREDPLFEVNDVELARSGPSFTLDTVHELERRGWPAVNWLIGADMLAYLPKWHRPLELLRQVTFWVARRPGHEIDWGALPGEYQGLRSQVVAAPEIEISASDIRRRVARGLSIKHMVPAAVERYVLENGLYRDGV